MRRDDLPSQIRATRDVTGGGDWRQDTSGRNGATKHTTTPRTVRAATSGRAILPHTTAPGDGQLSLSAKPKAAAVRPGCAFSLRKAAQASPASRTKVNRATSNHSTHGASADMSVRIIVQHNVAGVRHHGCYLSNRVPPRSGGAAFSVRKAAQASPGPRTKVNQAHQQTAHDANGEHRNARKLPHAMPPGRGTAVTVVQTESNQDQGGSCTPCTKLYNSCHRQCTTPTTTRWEPRVTMCTGRANLTQPRPRSCAHTRTQDVSFLAKNDTSV